MFRQRNIEGKNYHALGVIDIYTKSSVMECDYVGGMDGYMGGSKVGEPV